MTQTDKLLIGNLLNFGGVFASFMIRSDTLQAFQNLITHRVRFVASVTVMSSTYKYWWFDTLLDIFRKSFPLLLLTFLMKEVMARVYCTFSHNAANLSLFLAMLALLDSHQAVLTMNIVLSTSITSVSSLACHLLDTFLMIKLFAFSDALDACPWSLTSTTHLRVREVRLLSNVWLLLLWGVIIRCG